MSNVDKVLNPTEIANRCFSNIWITTKPEMM